MSGKAAGQDKRAGNPIYRQERVKTMIQDIYPSKLYNAYKNCKSEEGDKLLSFDADGRIMLEGEGDKMVFPKAETDDAVYLFSVDDEKYFLAMTEVQPKEDAHFYTIREVRDRFEGKEVFAVFTAYHLWKWYADNKFCGKCGHSLVHDEKERAMRCPECGNMIYPRINPAVIVGVINGDRLLITKYRRGYSHSALIAGFTEIGETLEETVAREVMEEAGIKVKNIRYYKSQPWGMAQDILVGYYCEADGDDKIRMDEGELKYAEWVKREDIVLQPNSLSLTNEMMSMFKNGKISSET